ncbi:lipopolysaccharide biosynthesis protein RfbH [Chloroflexota bacterium]
MINQGSTRRKQIKDQVRLFFEEEHGSSTFIPGQSSVPVSGKMYDAEDMEFLIDASLDFWLTTGRFANEFEKEFAQALNIRHALLVNSGSSANLLALSTLTSPHLGDKRLRPGDEIITTAASFPTTVNPIIQNNLIPVFVDLEPLETGTYNIDTTQLEAALSAQTRGIMVAHTLGNPFNLDAVMAFADVHDLYVIEDSCDALGATYQEKHVGSFGDISTVSFYPAHHITMGEGGAVLTNNSRLKKLLESFRDWGRDCWCEPGCDNTCGKRFDWQLGELPAGYDHKYTYSNIGYNLKVTDMQAAVGLSQLRKLPHFIELRQRNFDLLRKAFEQWEEYFILPNPTPQSTPSWFGFLLSVKEDAPFSRSELITYLESKHIATRLLFGGNVLRQPAYQGIEHRTIGSLEQADRVMHNTFWIGVYPGITPEMIAYMVDCFAEWIGQNS